MATLYAWIPYRYDSINAVPMPYTSSPFPREKRAVPRIPLYCFPTRIWAAYVCDNQNHHRYYILHFLFSTYGSCLLREKANGCTL